MTRSELVDSLANCFPQLARKDAEVAVNEIFVAISHALIKGRRVEIRGFGSFSLGH
jgi:integration host factor subunit beta